MSTWLGILAFVALSAGLALSGADARGDALLQYGIGCAVLAVATRKPV